MTVRGLLVLTWTIRYRARGDTTIAFVHGSLVLIVGSLAILSAALEGSRHLLLIAMTIVFLSDLVLRESTARRYRQSWACGQMRRDERRPAQGARRPSVDPARPVGVGSRTGRNRGWM